ncbi:MAG: hypothetical protein MHMPM18_000345 [Marteilia pararefringens]
MIGETQMKLKSSKYFAARKFKNDYQANDHLIRINPIGIPSKDSLLQIPERSNLAFSLRSDIEGENARYWWSFRTIIALGSADYFDATLNDVKTISEFIKHLDVIDHNFEEIREEQKQSTSIQSLKSQHCGENNNKYNNNISFEINSKIYKNGKFVFEENKELFESQEIFDTQIDISDGVSHYSSYPSNCVGLYEPDIELFDIEGELSTLHEMLVLKDKREDRDKEEFQRKFSNIFGNLEEIDID